MSLLPTSQLHDSGHMPEPPINKLDPSSPNFWQTKFCRNLKNPDRDQLRHLASAAAQFRAYSEHSNVHADLIRNEDAEAALYASLNVLKPPRTQLAPTTRTTRASALQSGNILGCPHTWNTWVNLGREARTATRLSLQDIRDSPLPHFPPFQQALSTTNSSPHDSLHTRTT